MKTYRREERKSGYKQITTVTDSGDWEMFAQWPDGTTSKYFKMNIFEIGWPSLRSFLSSRPNFKKV